MTNEHLREKIREIVFGEPEEDRSEELKNAMENDLDNLMALFKEQKDEVLKEYSKLCKEFAEEDVMCDVMYLFKKALVNKGLWYEEPTNEDLVKSDKDPTDDLICPDFPFMTDDHKKWGK